MSSLTSSNIAFFDNKSLFLLFLSKLLMLMSNNTMYVVQFFFNYTVPNKLSKKSFSLYICFRPFLSIQAVFCLAKTMASIVSIVNRMCTKNDVGRNIEN